MTTTPEPTLARLAAGPGPARAPEVVGAVLRSPGRPLPTAIRSIMETRLGHDFGTVRVHADEPAAQAARAVHAMAWTVGRDIAFDTGRYAPETDAGRRLLTHELAHVVQQRGAAGLASPAGGLSRRPGVEGTWTMGDVRDPAEREAHDAASALFSGARAHATPGASGGLVLRRTPEDGDPAGETATPPPTLTNSRFVGDRILDGILAGRIPALSSAHNGRRGAVSKVQRALVALGFELPMFQTDGSYGSETEEAIRQFRARYGPSPGNLMDGPTLAVLDRVAPPPGVRQEHTVDYDRLLADRRLDITVGIGATDTTVHRETRHGRYKSTGRPTEELEADRFRDWMRRYGFHLELLGLSGNEYWKARRTITWTGSDGAHHTRAVDVWINLVVPHAGAARAFREGLSSDEITLYSGHARYGSGPDFDAKSSPVENFRLAIDRALRAAGRRTTVEEARHHGVALDEENDLLEMVRSGSWDPNRYRVLFFNACTSLAYLDEIREQIGGPERVDVVATRRPSVFTTLESRVNVAEVERFLEGIFAAESVESMVAALNELQRRGYGRRYPRGGVFTSSGMGDNPRAP